jgi:hypothetical protein
VRPGPAACALVALAAAGCGRASEPPAASAPTTTPPPATAPATTPAQAPARVVILAPRRGDAVRAARVGAGRAAGALTVTGTADPQQTVAVDGRCPARACRTTVFTDLAGRWSARVRLVVPARARHWTVRARYATAGGPRARARVTIHVAPPTPRPAPAPAPAPSGPATPAPTAPPRLVLVGDSLAVGMRALLPAALPGWRVEVHAKVGRAVGEGLRILDGLRLQPGSPSAPLVVAASLFDNDAPTNLGALGQAVRATVARAGPGGCAVWATLSRPPLRGVGFGAANRVLEGLAAEPRSGGRLVLVPWADEARAHPELLGRDRVHPTRAGYAVLARLYAQAAQACV